MAGLYIHIPFCASRCIYCSFYSTTSLQLSNQYVDTLCKEIDLRRKEVDTIQTIYLGGGTPSLLSPAHLQRLFQKIKSSFSTASDMEVTIECNPDDITTEFADCLANLPINRVSMGVQTFSNERLKFLRRRHTKEDVYKAVERLRNAGITNISIDLIFGFPLEQLTDWEVDIDEALKLNIQHISAYSLSYEEGTPLHRMRKSGTITDIDEELSLQMYDLLVKKLTENGFEHYEISNFAKTATALDGTAISFRSKHNSSYWHSIPYLGIGAAAHSYDGETRKWNIADLKTYMNSISKGILPLEIETLEEPTRYNDCITTVLRTKEGINLEWFKKNFNYELYDYLLRESAPYIKANQLTIHNNHLALTAEGIFISDMIMSDLIYV